MGSFTADEQANQHRERDGANKPNFVMLIMMVHSHTSAGDLIVKG